MPDAFRDRLRRLLSEAMRFFVVGGVATVVAVLGFNMLLHGTLLGFAPLDNRPIPAYVVANVVAGLIAYTGMRLWAFSHRDAPTPMGLVMFVVLGVATMALPVVCLAVSRYLLGLDSQLADNISANVIGLGLGAAARFLLFRRFVFTHPDARVRSSARTRSGRATPSA